MIDYMPRIITYIDYHINDCSLSPCEVKNEDGQEVII